MKYCQQKVAKICNYIAEGKTYADACKLSGLNQATFYRWMESKSDFCEAVKKAKEQYEEWLLNGILDDAKKSLKTLICGLDYEEVKTEYEQDPRNPTSPRIKRQTRVTKKVLPNPTAVIFALCNRDPEHWQNRVNTELSGKVETETKSNVSLANVPDDLLAKVIDAINGK